jgi:hypothetical protein
MKILFALPATIGIVGLVCPRICAYLRSAH